MTADGKSAEELLEWLTKWRADFDGFSDDERAHFDLIAGQLLKRAEWVKKSRENQRAYRERKK